MILSAFSVVKNEAQFIGYGLMSILDSVDEVVYFDGNSTDGTLKLLDYIKGKYDPENKIRVFQNKDFSDFKGDYVRVFNECLKECRGKYVWFAHPDMILANPGAFKDRKDWTAKAYYTNMRSFAGEDMNLEIVAGRGSKWKNIMQNAFGLHYWGAYGSDHEDMYFREITGNQHLVHKNMRLYPYRVEDSGMDIWHMCECKPRLRREEKMRSVLQTNVEVPATSEHLNELVYNHPRVHLASGDSVFGRFTFAERQDPLPQVFERYREEFEKVLNDPS